MQEKTFSGGVSGLDVAQCPYFYTVVHMSECGKKHVALFSKFELLMLLDIVSSYDNCFIQSV